MMFWLKNFRMRGMQLAKTRCWAMYSNYETEWQFSQEEHLSSFRKDSRKGGLWTRPGRCGLAWSVSGAAAGWQRWPSRWSPCVDWRRRRVSCFAALWSCNQNQLPVTLTPFTQLTHLSLDYESLDLWKHRKFQCFSHLSQESKGQCWNIWPPMRTQQHTGDKLALGDTYGISSGSTSARMLIESVLAFEVGAAASRIFSRAIWRFQTRKKASDQTLNETAA